MTAIALNAAETLKFEVEEVSREQQFNELVSVYMDDLYRYGYWLTGDKAVADDLVQETMVHAWKSLHKLQNPKAVKGWLITILRRENARRAGQSREQRPGENVDRQHQPRSEAIGHPTRRDLTQRVRPEERPGIPVDWRPM